MKATSTTSLTLIAALIFGIIPASSAKAQVLFSDDFESGTAGADINGKAIPQGSASWSTNYISSIFKYQQNISPANVELGELNAQFWANPKGRGVATLSADLSAIPGYNFDIGYLWLNGVGSLGINVRSTSPADSHSYWFTRGVFEGGTKIRVSWKDASGTETQLGYLPVQLTNKGLACTAISIRITGNTQQLHVNGAPFDTEPRPVQPSATAQTAANIRLTAIASPASPVDIRIDNMTITRSDDSAR